MRLFARFPLFILFIFALPAMLFADTFGNQIKGSVTDSQSGKELKNVNVYLSKTTFNTTTNKQGFYTLENVQPGLHKLVYRAEGYKPHVVQIHIEKNKTYQFDVKLISQPSTNHELLTKKVRDKDWEENFKEFEEIFLGRSAYAKQTKIKNPKVIELSVSENNIMTADSEDAIHLVNEALGYELFITIQTFSWNLKKDSGQFLNLIRMNKLFPSSPQEAELWESNRESAYDNSLRKFLNELVHDKQSFKNQRWAYQIGDYGVKAWGNYSGKFVKVDKQELQSETDLEDIYNNNIHIYSIESNYHSTSSIAVVLSYRGRSQFSMIAKEYDRYGNAYYYDQHRKLSYLGHINTKGEGYLLIDDYGNLLNPLEITLSGYWTKQRMGDFLPFDYQPALNSVASR